MLTNTKDKPSDNAIFAKRSFHINKIEILILEFILEIDLLDVVFVEEYFQTNQIEKYICMLMNKNTDYYIIKSDVC